MAAEMMEKIGQQMGIDVIVETNGAIGVENKLTVEDIKSSIAVIIAADIKVDLERFKGKPLIEVSVSQAIKHPQQLIQDAIDGKYMIY